MSEKIVNSIKKSMVNFGIYTGASILGPLILFAGLGYLLDHYLQTKPIMMIVGVFVAFIFTNIFLYKKVTSLNKLIKKQTKDNRKDNIDNAA